MKLDIDPADFAHTGQKPFQLKKAPTKIKDHYADKADYQDRLAEYREEIDELQSRMYAHNRYGLLLVFQALDAAGKDGTIQHVMSGVNPFGVKIHNFKRPTEAELEHDFLWRTTLALPERGTIGIFNRSYYEEVLVVKVHPEILSATQRLPAEFSKDLDQVWQHRYEALRDFERYLHHNGIVVVKFFLNVSKEEQADRLIARIEDPAKNWKFEEGDVRERDFWNAYQQAYEDAINETAAPHAPWYVIPADDKKNMRLIVSQIVLKTLQSLKMEYPPSSEARQKELKKFVDVIREQNEA
jgi:PPK2 family polyphosphate:nucleotide phosphotransferase